jgi:hypothetical protein
MKHPIKWKIYFLATRVWDWNIPGLRYLADKVRDWTFNEDMYYD